MQLGTRQWEILAVDVPTGVIHQGLVYIEAITFVGYTNAADNFLIQDRDGNTVWEGKGHTDLSPVDSGTLTTVANGIQVPTLDTGKLLFYIR